MSVVEPSVPALLGEQARQQPDAPAHTFIDYEVDSAGCSQTLTWSEVNERVQVVADELASCGSPGGERLVAIVELKKRGSSDEEVLSRLDGIEREVTSSISASYGLRVADPVLVSPGSLPITTSGKVRRSACAERYRQDEFTRLDTA